MRTSNLANSILAGVIGASTLLFGAGSCKSTPDLPVRDFSNFNGSYREASERRGRPCRASVDCDSSTDSCTIKVERGSWGKDSTGRVVKLEGGLLEISNEKEMEGQIATAEKAVVIQTASVSRGGKGTLISVTNVTKRKGEGVKGARSRMKCGALVRRKTE